MSDSNLVFTMVPTKVCTGPDSCGEELPLVFFSNVSSSAVNPEGKRRLCRKCMARLQRKRDRASPKYVKKTYVNVMFKQVPFLGDYFIYGNK